MDFKGVAWAGDIYQKFEAMCLEVEEVMYQDSVKYVETQAQKVGVSVKKFYSEVMQDLMSSSCVDPVKLTAGDLSVNPYPHTDLSKKPKSFFSNTPRELKKIETEDEAIPDTILPLLRSGVLVQNTYSEFCSLKSKRLGVHRHSIGIKRISQLDRPSKVSSPTSLLGLGSSDSASCGGSGSRVKASGDINLKSPSDSVEKCDPEPVNESTPVSDIKIESSVSDKIISAGSARRNKEPECTSSLGASVNGSSFSQMGSNITTNACGIESVGEKVMTSDEDTTIKRDSFFESTPDISSDTRNVEFAEEKVVLSIEDIPRELKKMETEDESIPDTILPLLRSGVLVQNTYSEFCSSKSKRLGVHRHSIGIKRISQLDRPSKVSSPTSLLGSSDIASCGGIGSRLKASGDINLKSRSDSVEKCDPEPVNESTPVSDAKIESSVSGKIISAGSARRNKDEPECTSSLATSVNGSSISQTGTNITTNACDIESVGEKVMTSDEDTTIKHDSFFESTPDISGDTRNVEFAEEDVVLSNEENFDMEVIQNEEVFEPRTETLEIFEGSVLEETCVFVEGDDIDFLPRGTRKHKSYKKKIRDALSSRLRSTKKEGYTHVGGKNNPEEKIPALSIELDEKQKTTAHDSLESEWELL